MLSDREEEVLKLIMQELSSKEIASELHVSESTIKSHRKNMISKLGGRNMMCLAKYAFKHNIYNGETNITSCTNFH